MVLSECGVGAVVLRWSWLGLLGMAGATLAAAEPTPPPGEPGLAIQVERAILVRSADPTKPAATKVSAEAFGFPAGAKLTYTWTQVQDVMSPLAADVAAKPVAIADPAKPLTEVRFPDWGVYELRLTVTDAVSHQTAARNTWVNVWDDRSHLVVDGKADPLGVAPGMTPPPSVRNLAPDPGPFRHPRVLVTDRDWLDISTRARTGKIAGKGFADLTKGVAGTIDDPKHAHGRLTAALAAWAAGKFAGPEPDLTLGIPSEQGEKGPDWGAMRRGLHEYDERLRDACLLAWLAEDPAKPRKKAPPAHQARCRMLASVVAAVAKIHLRHCWTAAGGFTPQDPLFIPRLDLIGEGIGGQFSDLALAYDFIAPWMTEDEAKASREFAFALGAGRTTGERTVFFQNGIHGRVHRGQEHNGDFVNMEERQVFTSLSVEGEESAMDPVLVKTFTTAPKPADHATNPDHFACDWMLPWEVDGGGGSTVSRAYYPASAWPHARKVAIDNLQRYIWWNDDWYVSPWGFELNREAYYGFSTIWGWPAALAFARRGENQFVTGFFYTTVNHLLWSCYPGQGDVTGNGYTSKIRLFDHHDSGGWDYRQAHILLLKYLYPDDPVVDYLYAANAPLLGWSPLNTLLFGLDPGLKGKPTVLPALAKDKKLPLTKLDPQQGTVVSRSGWNEDDLMVSFDSTWIGTGHMHAEKNSFALFALGRVWAMPPGYHVVPSNYHTGIQIRDPRWADDAATEGFIGQSPAEMPAAANAPHCFPTPPGRLVAVREDDQHLVTTIVGDASAAYNFSFGPDQVDTGLKMHQFMYPGLRQEMESRQPGLAEWFDAPLRATPNFNPVQHAWRTLLLARSVRPYLLVVDDIQKDDQARDYRWTMNCCQAFGPPDGAFLDAAGKPVRSSLTIQAKATAAEGILLHAPIDAGAEPGKPRMLVRDLAPVLWAKETAKESARHPAIRVDPRLDDPTPSCRLQIDRHGVVSPGYVLLFLPHRSGERLPTTTWNPDATELSITFRDGTKDVYKFDRSQADHRTRVTPLRVGGRTPAP